jgi:hypothetical protein
MVQNMVRQIIQSGYAASQFLLQVSTVVIRWIFRIPCFIDASIFPHFQLNDKLTIENDLTSKQKALFSQKVAEIDRRLTDGCDEHLQLLDLAVSLMKIMTAS